MILSDVNIYRYTWRGQPDVEVVDIYVGSRHEYEDAYHIRDDCSSFDKINVNFHNTLSSEIKDEICCPVPLGEVEVGLGWDEGSCPAWAGMRNVEAGLGRGEGGSERIREAWGEGGWS
jgi:hypothetical protein